MNDYYVYVYLDTRKPGNYQFGSLFFNFEPFYVGKGTNKRYKEHLSEAYHNTKRGKNPHKCNKICKIKQETDKDPAIVFIYNNLTPEEAVTLEIESIDNIGRRNTKQGPLTNITRGGQGGCGPHSEETKRKMSEATKGRPKTKEHIAALKEGNASKRKQWKVTSPDGIETTVDRLQDFCKDYNLVYREMLKVSMRTEENKHIHRAKSHRGWKCHQHIC